MFLVCTVPTLPRPWVTRAQKTVTIMIDPAGDARQTGRTIGSNFERGITMQCAEHLAQLLKKESSAVTTVITRAPAELVPELQNANYANRLNVDLFISLNFCHTHNTRPNMWVYRYAQANDFLAPQPQLSFCSYDQAYLFNNKITATLATEIERLLATSTQFDAHGPYKLPFKPLVGIIAPAIAFEMELKDEGDWQTYAEPLAQAIIQTLRKHGVLP
jgi:N-acetylmuramoyl-L-alanine amidase